MVHVVVKLDTLAQAPLSETVALSMETAVAQEISAAPVVKPNSESVRNRWMALVARQTVYHAQGLASETAVRSGATAAVL